jgi:hypothetical protein
MNDNPFRILCIGFFCSWLWSSAYPPVSFAGILTIETQTSVQATEDQLEVAVKITNKGDEPAYNTQINLMVLDEKTQGDVKAKLDPDKSDVNTFIKKLSGIARGRYPLTIRVDFHDANLYPFSALSGSTFFIGKDVIGDIVVIGENTSLDKAGELNFHVKNMGSDPINLSASLILPKEFSAATSKKFFQINAGSEKKLLFAVNNFSARNGALYPLYCSFEYDMDNIHYTSIANIFVTVKVVEGWFHRLKWIWIGTIIILMVMVCGIFILQKKAKPAPQ